MITRSRARAQRESSSTSIEHTLIFKRATASCRDHIEPRHLEHANMGTRGGKSGRGTSTRSKPVHLFDVPPVRLFSSADEDNREDKNVSTRIVLHSNSSSAGDSGDEQPLVEAAAMENDTKTSVRKQPREGADDDEQVLRNPFYVSRRTIHMLLRNFQNRCDQVLDLR